MYFLTPGDAGGMVPVLATVGGMYGEGDITNITIKMNDPSFFPQMGFVIMPCTIFISYANEFYEWQDEFINAILISKTYECNIRSINSEA